MKVIVEAKPSYGNLKYYPICADSIRFAKIAGTKTLTPDTLRTIKELGYEVSIQHSNLGEF